MFTSGSFPVEQEGHPCGRAGPCSPLGNVSVLTRRGAEGPVLAHPGTVGGGVGGSGCGACFSGLSSDLLSACCPPCPPWRGQAARQFCVQCVFLAHLPSGQASLGFMVWRGRSPQSSTPECRVINRCGGTHRASLLPCVGPWGMTRGTSPGEDA